MVSIFFSVYVIKMLHIFQRNEIVREGGILTIVGFQYADTHSNKTQE